MKMEALNKSIALNGLVRAVEETESRTVEFVISTETIDRHGTVFMADGWDLDEYRKNPIVAYQHETNGSWLGDSDPDSIIGTSEVRIEDGKLIATATFEDAELNPKADKIYRKILAGTLRAASVGVRPTEGHWGREEAGENPDVLYFTRQSLIEWSVVNIPSNPDALKRNLSNFKEDFPKPDNQTSNQRGLSLYEAQLQINKNKAL